LITVEHSTDARQAQHLKKSGHSTQATITRKRATSSGQGRDLCYVTYQFKARQASAPSAPVATFSREVEVQDGFFDSVTEGQSIAVLDDPADPSISTADELVRRPRSPTWLVCAWWVGMGIAVSALLWICIGQFQQSRASGSPPPASP
jgi:hypothetical protein